MRWCPHGIKFQRHSWGLASRSLRGEHEQVDPDYSVPCYCSSPLPSNGCLPANGKCDKYWGSSSDKTLDYTIHWSRAPEPEIVGPAASENTVPSIDWRLERDLEPQSYGSSVFPNPDSEEQCNDQDLLKRHHNTAKKPLETNSSKVKVKSTMMIPDSQKLLRCELESLKSQLQAQTKAFEFLNHSVTMLEKESCLQQIKIQQLEEVLSPMSRQTEKEGHKWGMEQGRQELYGALAQGLQGLQKTLRDSEEVQRARTTRCLQLLAQEIRDRLHCPLSKKFLWEELELVREEVTFIYQKLQAQEDEITENLVNIQKMQKTQVKCRKVLTKMKQQGYETSNWPDTEEMPPGGRGSWRDDLQKELSDIWSAVHLLQNSFDGFTMSSGLPRALNLRGYKGHRGLSPLFLSWDSDSDQDPSQPPFSKSRSFPSGTEAPLLYPTLPLLACPPVPQYGPSQLTTWASAP
ncbi:coiled-coil domain-containing protein 159 isoform X1 [Leptonychotes weddellii]|uniref:Coiled-coil domain-containing protein 159 isoform X1 n=2 Tax=Leptonychotes weddellii TaxID=9713 RepID=A0A7F8RR92_LEPWE|nr:coiled-coil domain-containing protein 159 isoform X1 [Leptonychotes weddellii]